MRRRPPLFSSLTNLWREKARAQLGPLSREYYREARFVDGTRKRKRWKLATKLEDKQREMPDF